METPSSLRYNPANNVTTRKGLRIYFLTFIEKTNKICIRKRRLHPKLQLLSIFHSYRQAIFHSRIQSSEENNLQNSQTLKTRFVRTATNKQKCPVYQIVWTPDGRRLVTGAASGEFTLWNGMAFNFETILQAHDQPVRSMSWSQNGNWLATGDQGGYIKYWQQNMNNCCMFQGKLFEAIVVRIDF